MQIKCKIIVKGNTEGKVLKTDKPINFLMLDEEGIIHDEMHPLNKQSIANKILVFPNAIGSSVGAYKIYAMKVNNRAPLGIICLKADIITASGCAIANIPLVQCMEEDFNKIKNDMEIRIDSDKSCLIIKNYH